MKKKALAGFAAVLPITLLLCACSSSAVTLSANWYQSGDGSSVSGKSERLEYEVTFQPKDETVTFLTYENGTYVTELKAEPVALSDGKEILGYHLHSELAISAVYTVGNESQTFTDSVVSDVYFKTLDYDLQPVKSIKKVRSASPLKNNPKTLEEAYEVYEYTLEIKYSDSLSKAEIAYTSTLPEEKTVEKKISVHNKSVFFDNEQLLFVLRGLDMKSSAGLKTISPLDLKERSVNMYTPQAVSYNKPFTVNGTPVEMSEEKPVIAFGVKLMYDGTYTGQPQSLIYAANTAQSKNGVNLYRNALLFMEVPVLQGLGALQYRLINAQFND